MVVNLLSPSGRTGDVYYGSEKVRQMIRSLLPSTNRNGARNDKRAVKQAFRSKNKRKLRQVAAHSYEWDDDIWFENDARELRMVVQNRRNADKVGPFINWVTAKTKDMPQENRKSYVRRLVPDNTIGQHALTHLPRSGFDHPTVDYVNSLPKVKRKYFYNYKTKKMELRPPKQRFLSFEEYQILIRRVLERGYHKALNQAIEHVTATKQEGFRTHRDPYNGKIIQIPLYVKVGPTSARKLLGWHDVDSFITDVLNGHKGTYDYRKDGSYHPEWAKSLNKFLRNHREELS